MKWRPIVLASACVPLLLSALVSAAWADEIRLKDGSKIIGTIVGYEDDAFKVETAYGFALVRKNTIAEIVPSEPKKPAPLKTPVAPSASPSTASDKPGAKLTEAAEPGPMPAPSAATLSVTPPLAPPAPPIVPPVVPPFPAPGAARNTPSNARQLSPAVAPKVTISASAKSAPPITLPAPAAPPPAAKPSSPASVQEHVTGNLYVNQTYGFQMYKPPDWNLIGDARSALPNAIAALGTNDQNTLLVVGLNTLGRNSLLDSGASRSSGNAGSNSDSLAAHAAATEHALRQIYENYRPMPQRRSTVAGLPAIEQRFRGSLDNIDWSVIVLTFVRDTEVFTILGMTHADDDLIQIQENVIAKTIGSLQFTTPAR
jgi:hypothetical protein